MSCEYLNDGFCSCINSFVPASLCVRCLRKGRKFNCTEAKEKIIKSTTEKVEPPTVLQMAEHFAKSMIKWAGSGFDLVDKDEYMRRRKICNECSGGWRCPHCGCSLWAKARLKTQECHKNLW